MKIDVLDQATVLYLEGNILDETAMADTLSFYEIESNNWKSKHVIVDLTQVHVINSIGINLLIRLLTKTRIKGGDLVLTGLQDKVAQVVQLTKLNDVFKISKDIDQAINILNQTK